MYQNIPEMSKISKIDGYFDIFDICQKYRYISGTFLRNFIPGKSGRFSENFRPSKIFDCRKFSTFDFREIPKISGKRMALVSIANNEGDLTYNTFWQYNEKLSQ